MLKYEFEKISFLKRVSKHLIPMHILTIILIIFSWGEISNLIINAPPLASILTLSFIFAIFIWGIYIRNITSMIYEIFYFELTDEKIKINYFRFTKEKEVILDFKDVIIEKGACFSVFRVRFLKIKHNKKTIIKQFNTANWTEEMIDEVEKQYKDLKRALRYKI